MPPRLSLSEIAISLKKTVYRFLGVLALLNTHSIFLFCETQIYLLNNVSPFLKIWQKVPKMPILKTTTYNFLCAKLISTKCCGIKMGKIVK